MTYHVRPDVVGVSPLGTPVDAMRVVPERTAPVYGFALHCTGSGLTADAIRHGVDVLKFAGDYYQKPGTYFAHYVIGFAGEVVQISDEHLHAQHVGFLAAERAAFLDGSWKTKVDPWYAGAWAKRWPNYKSPAHLFPGPSPNDVYVGAEMLVWANGCPGRPLGSGTNHTAEQHVVAARLVADVAARWGFPPGWQDTGRLACHEDLNPLNRSNGFGGWDPGVLRKSADLALFDWEYFKANIPKDLGAGAPTV